MKVTSDSIGRAPIWFNAISKQFQGEEYAEERDKVKRRFRNLSFVDYSNIKVEKVLAKTEYVSKSYRTLPAYPHFFNRALWSESEKLSDQFHAFHRNDYKGYCSGYLGWAYCITLPIRDNYYTLKILATTKEFLFEFLELPDVMNKQDGIEFLQNSKLDMFYICSPACERVAGTTSTAQAEPWNQPISPEDWVATRFLSAVSAGYIDITLKIPGVIVANTNKDSGRVNKVIGNLTRASLYKGTLTPDRIA